MKSFRQLVGIFTLAFSSLGSASDVETKSSPVMETKGYGMQRYAVLFGRSPFDVDSIAPLPPPQARAMEGWALAGLTKATEYSIVNLVNLKTQERLRIPLYVNPPSPKANRTVVGSEIYTLVTLDFPDGQPQSVKNARALVSKNGQQDVVTFDPKVLQLKPVAAKTPLPATEVALVPTKAEHRRVVMPNNPTP